MKKTKNRATLDIRNKKITNRIIEMSINSLPGIGSNVPTEFFFSTKKKRAIRQCNIS